MLVLDFHFYFQVRAAHENNVKGLVPKPLVRKCKGSIHRNRNIGYEDSPRSNQSVCGISGILVAIRTTGNYICIL